MACSAESCDSLVGASCASLVGGYDSSTAIGVPAAAEVDDKLTVGKTEKTLNSLAARLRILESKENGKVLENDPFATADQQVAKQLHNDLDLPTDNGEKADPSQEPLPVALVIFEMARSPEPLRVMMEGLVASRAAQRLERGWLMSSTHSPGSIRAMFDNQKIAFALRDLRPRHIVVPDGDAADVFVKALELTPKKCKDGMRFRILDVAQQGAPKTQRPTTSSRSDAT